MYNNAVHISYEVGRYVTFSNLRINFRLLGRNILRRKNFFT